MEIEEEVLSKILPKEDENDLIFRVVEKTQAKILALAKELGIDAEAILVGSVAKDTHLTDPDVDIFVMFPPNTKREDLEHYGLEIGGKVLEDAEKKYAEHPYLYGIIDGLNVEIVPCYKIEDPSEKMSAVDRTPFHTRYVIEHQKPEQKDQVRLLKQFLKGIGIYGAESEIEGFSGYLCELLILYYGDFNKLIDNVRNWKKGIVLIFHEKEHEEFKDSLVVIDPVDPNRNVASALSEKNFATFIHACKEYSKEPKIEFFFPNPPIPKSLSEIENTMKRRGTTVVGITFKSPSILPDILHSQLRKSVKAVEKLCDRSGFSLIDSDYFVNHETMLLLEFDIFTLPSAKQHRGPPVWHQNVTDFFEKWTGSARLLKGPYIVGENWYVDIEREFTNAKELIVSELETLDLGSHIKESAKEDHKILVGSELLDEKYLLWLTIFFDAKFRWEY
jgi:tRNA nucleotidyltransferase (CCA-adding enzyme)